MARFIQQNKIAVGPDIYADPAGSSTGFGDNPSEPISLLRAAEILSNADRYDIKPNVNQECILHLADGTYPAPFSYVVSNLYIRGANLVIEGNTTNPQNVLIQKTDGNSQAPIVALHTVMAVRGVTFQNSSGDGIEARGNNAALNLSNINFEDCLYDCIFLNNNASALLNGTFRFTAANSGPDAFIRTREDSVAMLENITLDFQGNSWDFFQDLIAVNDGNTVGSLSWVAGENVSGAGFSGNATGSRTLSANDLPFRTGYAYDYFYEGAEGIIAANGQVATTTDNRIVIYKFTSSGLDLTDYLNSLPVNSVIRFTSRFAPELQFYATLTSSLVENASGAFVGDINYQASSTTWATQVPGILTFDAGAAPTVPSDNLNITDGTTSVNDVTDLTISGATVSDNGGGSATLIITASGGGSLTITDGNGTLTNIDTLTLTNLTATAGGAGEATIAAQSYNWSIQQGTDPSIPDITSLTVNGATVSSPGAGQAVLTIPPGTAAPTVQAYSQTSGSIVDTQFENVDLSLFLAGVIGSVSADQPSLLRGYSSAAARTADTGRAAGAAPANVQGLVFEVEITAANQVISLSPSLSFIDLDSNNDLYLQVFNQSGADTSIQVTVTGINLV